MRRAQTRFQAEVQQVAQDLTHAHGEVKTDVRDSWDTELRLNVSVECPRLGGAQRGPTSDSTRPTIWRRISNCAPGRWRTAVGRNGFEVEVEHDRGPFNGRAEVTRIGDGSVGRGNSRRDTDCSRTGRGCAYGEGQRGGSIHACWTGSGRIPTAGRVAGFPSATRAVTLEGSDRAVLAAVLQVGTVTEAVEVSAVPLPINGRGMAGGIPGGVVGGVIAAVRAVAMPMAPRAMAVEMAAEMRMDLKDMAVNSATVVKKERDSVGAAAPHVRSWFPEALYINPEIVTDRDGRASIVVPIADSITTWRMAMMASTTHGALGSGTGSVKVFQDFFVDLDLPVTLTQGDRVSIPVAAYNYSGKAGDVALQLQDADWFTLVEDVPAKTVAVESGKVGGSQFTLEAKRIGKFKLTLTARMAGANRADIVVREIEVVPNGREQNSVFNGRLESTVRHEVTFPQTAIADAGKVFVRLYPGPLSRVIEGWTAFCGCRAAASSRRHRAPIRTCLRWIT